MAAQRYKPGVIPVLVLGIERPALAAALAARGLAAKRTAPGVVAALVPQDAPRPVCPAIIEVRDLTQASALLDEGADDVVLASDPDGFVAARLAALVRRSQPGIIKVGDLAIDALDRRATLGGKPLALLPREFALLLYLARHVGQAVDHSTLHRAIWGREFDPGTNVIAVHVSRLRAKLGPGGVTVVTARGRGYCLVAPVAGAGERA